MLSRRNIAAIPLAGAFAAFGSLVQAAPVTLATIDVDGSYFIDQDGLTTSAGLTGAFAGDASGLVGIDFDMPMDYIFGASLSVNGSTLFDGDLEADGTSLNEVIAVALGLLGDINDGLGGVPLAVFADLLDDGQASIPPFLDVVISDFSLGATGFSGLFDIGLFLPFSDDGCGLFAVQSFLGGDGGGLSIPCSGEGTFALDLSISKDVAPIPLPAGAPLLLVGLGGLAVLRRRST